MAYTYSNDLQDYGLPGLLAEVKKLVEAGRPAPGDVEYIVRAVHEDLVEWLQWYGTLFTQSEAVSRRDYDAGEWVPDALIDRGWLEGFKEPAAITRWKSGDPLYAEVEKLIKEDFGSPDVPPGADWQDAVLTVAARALTWQQWYPQRVERELEEYIDAFVNDAIIAGVGQREVEDLP